MDAAQAFDFTHDPSGTVAFDLRYFIDVLDGRTVPPKEAMGAQFASVESVAIADSTCRMPKTLIASTSSFLALAGCEPPHSSQHEIQQKFKTRRGFDVRSERTLRDIQQIQLGIQLIQPPGYY